SSRSGKESGLMIALSVSKWTLPLRRTRSDSSVTSGPVTGQPSFSAGPGSSGHLSSGSGMPSLSRSGQPSSSTVPGSRGHRSSTLGMPSLSQSRSGQPSGPSPGSSGHLSRSSGTPSWSPSLITTGGPGSNS